MYNPSSLNAEEFICHDEALASIAYASENRNNLGLVDSIIEKAERKKGLSHREASVLLACDVPEKVQKIYALAERIKQDIYGNRIVMFAPLYLSNYCINSCSYCPYHAKNKHIARKKLTQEDIAREVTALQDMGHKRLAIESGEDPLNNPIEYILESIRTIYSVKHRNGAIRRVNVNIAATTVEKPPESGPTFCSKKRITGRVMRSSTRRGRSTIMPIIPKRWTEPCRVESTMWASVSCSASKGIATSSPRC